MTDSENDNLDELSEQQQNPEEPATTDDEQDSVADDGSAHESRYKVPQAYNESIKYHLTGMYKDWFLDYASYVILERAVPDIYDGLKPVQRRILHAMQRVDDGRYNKVANIIGQTMQYHPHGDQAIGVALVNLGQKDLLIDCQGNWGNILTGDGAAAPRYIEARLSEFALETVFNPKTTHWKLSYDGRQKEPINLPVKFPLLLAQGVEGIAVGLNSKILPHNFNELCDASLAYLRGEDFVLYPDFPTGGSIDVSRYQDGERGGMVKIRAKINKSADNKSLIITEIPFGTTTSKIIETILRANDKGKIKVKKVIDATAANAEIIVQLQPGYSSDKAIDALYAITDCEVSVSPNCCVVCDKKPMFTTVSNLLRQSTDHTLELLKWELEIQKRELEERYFYISLEKLFIEKRVYKEKEFEDSTTPEIAIRFIERALEPYLKDLIRPVTDDDLRKLLEIKMMRITRFDSKKADDTMLALKEKIADTQHNLDHLTDYTIKWFEHLKSKYGARYPRRTEVRNFANINIKTVVEANEKLYINRADGFIGTSLKRDEFLFGCSDIDDVIIFYKDGKYKIIKVADKIFVGTNILHIAIFKKNDERTIYNVVYRDGKSGPYYMKRFAITGLARDKEYDLTMGTAGSKVVYFTANPNGEAEVIRVLLKPALRLKKLEIIKDLSELAVKGRSSRGNLLTKFDIKSISLKSRGHSTLGGRNVWFDPDVCRLNYDGQGMYLGEFEDEDRILVITKKGEYYLSDFQLTSHFNDDILRIEKYDAEKIWSLAMWNNEFGFYYGKRFPMDALPKAQNFLGEDPLSRIVILTDSPQAAFRLHFADSQREPQDIQMAEFIDVKSAKAKGKRLTTFELTTIEDITPEPEPEPDAEKETNTEAELEANTDKDAKVDVADKAGTAQTSDVKAEIATETPAASQVDEIKETENNTKEVTKEVAKEVEAAKAVKADEVNDVDDIPMEIEVPQPEDSQVVVPEKRSSRKSRGAKSVSDDDDSQLSLF